jgi:DNA repair protein RecO (recombination protein O)
MERFVTKAMVLGCVDFGESDRIVALFSEERGRLSAFAAHAKNSKKRFGGALEPFTIVNASLTERRGDTFRFESADIQEPFLALRGDFAGITRASYAVELVREVCKDREPHPEIFGGLVGLMMRLSQAGGTAEDLLAFELGVLDEAGLRPQFEACARCQAVPGEHAGFDPSQGGVLCATCTRLDRRARPMSLGAIQALTRLQHGVRDPVAPAARREARGHLDAYLMHHLGRRLRSADYMQQVGVD